MTTIGRILLPSLFALSVTTPQRAEAPAAPEWSLNPEPSEKGLGRSLSPADPVRAVRREIETGEQYYDFQTLPQYGAPLVVIDLGHGERAGQSRTQGTTGELALIDAFGERLKQALQARGMHFVFTREPRQAYPYALKQAAPDLRADERDHAAGQPVNTSLRSRAQFAYTYGQRMNAPLIILVSIHANEDCATCSKPIIIFQRDENNHTPANPLSVELGRDIERHSPLAVQWQSRDLAILNEFETIRRLNMHTPKFRPFETISTLFMNTSSQDNFAPDGSAILFEVGSAAEASRKNTASQVSGLVNAIEKNIERYMQRSFYGLFPSYDEKLFSAPDDDDRFIKAPSV